MKNLIIKLISFQWQRQDSAMEVRGIWGWGQKYPSEIQTQNPTGIWGQSFQEPEIADENKTEK